MCYHLIKFFKHSEVTFITFRAEKMFSKQTYYESISNLLGLITAEAKMNRLSSDHIKNTLKKKKKTFKR